MDCYRINVVAYKTSANHQLHIALFSKKIILMRMAKRNIKVHTSTRYILNNMSLKLKLRPKIFFTNLNSRVKVLFYSNVTIFRVGRNST